MEEVIPRRGPGAARIAHAAVPTPCPAPVWEGSTHQMEHHFMPEDVPSLTPC